MNQALAFYRWTELDRTTYPEFLERIVGYELDPPRVEPRSHPGYPRIPLRRHRGRLLAPLDRSFLQRRSSQALDAGLPGRESLSRLLALAHGTVDEHARGPTPSAGGLQALELYCASFEDGWLPRGLYHYERADHALAQVRAGCQREALEALVPSMTMLQGGALLWVLVGDTARVTLKYGERGIRFLLLEAGHLMQNLCLACQSLGLMTVPLGGFLERELAAQFDLLESDAVLYVGLCGRRLRSGERR